MSFNISRLLIKMYCVYFFFLKKMWWWQWRWWIKELQVEIICTSQNCRKEKEIGFYFTFLHLLMRMQFSVLFLIPIYFDTDILESCKWFWSFLKVKCGEKETSFNLLPIIYYHMRKMCFLIVCDWVIAVRQLNYWVIKIEETMIVFFVW